MIDISGGCQNRGTEEACLKFMTFRAVLRPHESHFKNNATEDLRCVCNNTYLKGLARDRRSVSMLEGALDLL